jgi:hypothetical protein
VESWQLVDLGDSREKNLKLIYPVVEGGSGAIDGEGTVTFASLARPMMSYQNS